MAKKIDTKKRNEIIEKIPELKACFQCGTCAAACPANTYIGQFNPRLFILQALKGSRRMLSENLWRCITCNRCNELCPQGVNPYDVIVKFKNIAVEEGLIPSERAQALNEIYNNIRETGSTFFITEAVQRKREELGLKPIEFDNSELKKLFPEK